MKAEGSSFIDVLAQIVEKHWAASATDVIILHASELPPFSLSPALLPTPAADCLSPTENLWILNILDLPVPETDTDTDILSFDECCMVLLCLIFLSYSDDLVSIDSDFSSVDLDS